jgi:hypothetical protein
MFISRVRPSDSEEMYHGEVLETKVRLVTKPIRRVNLAYDHHVLNPDTEAAVRVVTWLYTTVRELTITERHSGPTVRDGHARLERGAVVCCRLWSAFCAFTCDQVDLTDSYTDALWA